MRIIAAQLNPTVGDLAGNCNKILAAIARAKSLNANLVVFPELCLSGYPPQDLLVLPHFLHAIPHFLDKIVKATSGIAAIVGLPRENPERYEKQVFNSAAVIHNGQLIGFQDKTLLPTYDVFDEMRYFEPASQTRCWNIGGKKIAVTICEDIWGHAELVSETNYRRDPIQELKSHQPDFAVNLSSSPFSLAKFDRRFAACATAAKALQCPLLLCNQVGGNDSLIFDGRSVAVDAEGNIMGLAKGFIEDDLLIDFQNPKIQPFPNFNPTQDLYDALILGIRDYFYKSGFKKACLGLSGGIDSAVVAGLAAEALGSQNILAVAMPSRFSSKTSLRDAKIVAEKLNIGLKDISIETPYQSFLDILTPHFAGKPFDVAEENIQARVRGIILMALSNKEGYIVLSTGNKSEMAMGYTTLYGDMCGGLAVLSDVTKKQVYALGRWINRNREIIPEEIFQKAPSAELRPNQTDQDSLPPYDIVDIVLEAYVERHESPAEISERYQLSRSLVDDLITRIHRNEYKRRQAPPGLRVSDKAFSVGRFFPIVQRWVD